MMFINNKLYCFSTFIFLFSFQQTCAKTVITSFRNLFCPLRRVSCRRQQKTLRRATKFDSKSSKERKIGVFRSRSRRVIHRLWKRKAKETRKKVISYLIGHALANDEVLGSQSRSRGHVSRLNLHQSNSENIFRLKIGKTRFSKIT